MKKVLLIDTVILFLLWRYCGDISQKIIGFDVFQKPVLQALWLEFRQGTLIIQSGQDWATLLFPLAYIFMTIVLLCVIPRLSFSGIGAFLRRVLRRCWRRYVVRPRLILRRHRLQKPRGLYTVHLPIAPRRQQPKMKQNNAPSRAPDIPAQPTPHQTTAPQQTTKPQSVTEPVQKETETQPDASKKGNIPAVAEIKELLAEYHFKPFSNLSIAGLSLPISGAKGNIALLFLFLNRPNAEWVVEENEDIAQGAWFSDTSFIPSPCQTLQKVKQALLKQDSGLKIYSFIVLAQGTVLGQQSLWDKFQKAGFTLVKSCDNMASGFTSIADFFQQHFTKE